MCLKIRRETGIFARRAARPAQIAKRFFYVDKRSRSKYNCFCSRVSDSFCGRGGIGRRVRLRGVWETVWVQVPSTAPTEKAPIYGCFFCWSANRRDLKGGKENAPVTRFPAPGFRARPSCAVRRTSKAMPMAEIKSHRPRHPEGMPLKLALRYKGHKV